MEQCSLPRQDCRNILLDPLHLTEDHTRLFSFPVDVEDFGDETAGGYGGVENVVEIDC